LSPLVLLAAVYVVAYVALDAWRRRAPGRVAVICPLREAAVPEELLERLGRALPLDDVTPFERVEFTVAFRSEAPGIALAAVADAASLEAVLGPYLRGGAFTPAYDWWLGLLGQGRWSAGLLFDLALEVLHRDEPRSLLVDLRPPPHDEARRLGIRTPETDVDLAMYAYEIRCRVRRYSRYRDTPCDLVFDTGATAWRLSG
jgi:hypothetical protein